MGTPRVVYSIGVTFAGGGIGSIAYRDVRALHAHHMLHRLLCGSYRPTEIPGPLIRAWGWPSRLLRVLALYDKRRFIAYIHAVLYDIWAARHVRAADIFHGWGNFSLRSLERARGAGALTLVTRASAHPLYEDALLRREYAHWGLTFRQPQGLLRRAVREIEEADYVLIPSPYVRDTFLRHGVPEEKLVQIPFGVDTRRFHPPEKRDSSPFRVLFLGQIGVRKGVPYLLEAWRRLGWGDAELWLVGRVEAGFGRVLARYRDMPGLRLRPYHPDPADLFRRAHVFAFPTITEGSALVTYEALASGLPVVTTFNAGSLVRDGQEGYIIPLRDVDMLAAKLDRLRRDDTLREEMARRARRRVEPYTWTRYGETLVHWISEILLRPKKLV